MTSCDWPCDYSGCSTADPAEAIYEEMARDMLNAWTRDVFGICDEEVRPCRTGCDQGIPSTFWGRSPWTGTSPNVPQQAYIPGYWTGALGCGCGHDYCSCSTVEQIKLPGPIVSVTEVLIDGTLFDPQHYRVDNGLWLVRLDGRSWPVCQDMAAPTTEEGTWQVAYKRGVPVPAGGRVAAGVLAKELEKAACNDPSCQLPRRIQNITRQGITVTLQDDFSDLERGGTGIWLVDSWVQSIVAPKRGGSVRSPDVRPKVRRTTWP